MKSQETNALTVDGWVTSGESDIREHRSRFACPLTLSSFTAKLQYRKQADTEIV